MEELAAAIGADPVEFSQLMRATFTDRVAGHTGDARATFARLATTLGCELTPAALDGVVALRRVVNCRPPVPVHVTAATVPTGLPRSVPGAPPLVLRRRPMTTARATAMPTTHTIRTPGTSTSACGALPARARAVSNSATGLGPLLWSWFSARSGRRPPAPTVGGRGRVAPVRSPGLWASVSDASAPSRPGGRRRRCCRRSQRCGRQPSQ